MLNRSQGGAFSMLVPGSEDEKRFVERLLKKHEQNILEKNPGKKVKGDAKSILRDK
jgi:hypothetical protein